MATAFQKADATGSSDLCGCRSVLALASWPRLCQASRRSTVRSGLSGLTGWPVLFLVDESGSMEGEKIEAARDTAVLLNEAMSGIRNVDLYIYGHTTENGQFVKLNAYREGKAPKDKHVLGSIDAHWSNIDSKAIREAASRVRARTREKCLFFVV